MTRIPVNIPQITPVMMSATSKTTDAESNGDFGKILENQKQISDDETKRLETENVDEAVESNKETEDDAVKTENVQESEIREEEPVAEVKEQRETNTGDEEAFREEVFVSEELMLQISSVLNTVCADVKEALAAELGISLEELDVALETFGISETDLLDWNTAKDVFLQMKGTDDVAMLLTDEGLYEEIRNLEKQFSEIMETVQETLELSEEEFVSLKEQIGKQSDTKPSVTELVEEPVESQLHVTEDKGQSTPQNHDNAFAAPQYGYSVNQNINMQQMTQTSSPQELIYANVDAENIMNQIIDYMKIQTDAQSSTMELQLQPESLGTLQIRISAREGIMTAQFTTASEAVKAVLESQIVQLQQQFENQNIKVDAIEVAVQTHGFESALEQGEERQQTTNDKKNRTRRIDLSRPDELEDASEEEKLVAEMMAQNGSTVDYLA